MRAMRRQIIGALITAGRPDLANYVAHGARAHGAVGYWEQQYRKLLLPARDLHKQVEFWRKQARQAKGGGSLLAKALDNASGRLTQFMRDIEPLRQGLGEPLGPHEVPRLRQAS